LQEALVWFGLVFATKVCNGTMITVDTIMINS
jgi:hypothetical protein